MNDTAFRLSADSIGCYELVGGSGGLAVDVTGMFDRWLIVTEAFIHCWIAAVYSKQIFGKEWAWRLTTLRTCLPRF
jgi:hypothetical protein